MHKSLFAASALALSVAVTPACATKKFVRTSVGEVNSKVDTVTKTVEETQARTTKNETRIGEVDSKAENAAKSAAAAGTAASAAAAAAKEANAKAVAADAHAAEAAANADKVDKASRRLILEVTLSEDQGNFAIAKAELPDTAKARIDQVIGQLKADPKNVFIEIEGHTDDRGDTIYNEKLGLERAETVKRYIYQQHKVPLHRISVISYGEDKPVAPNKTKDGRAQNRRVVIRVLS